MKGGKLLYILFLISTLVMSQESEGEYLLSQVNKHYVSKSNYVCELKYEMYKGYDKDLLTESYSSKIVKNGTTYKISYLEYEIFLYHEYQITVSNLEKEVFLGNSSMKFNQAYLFQMLKSTMDLFVISSFKSDKKFAYITMTPKTEEVSLYNKLEIKIDKSNYSIEEQTLYFSQKMPFKTNKGNTSLNNACLVVKIEEKPNNKMENIPSINHFIKNNNVTKKISLSSNYKGYKLVDQRKNN